MIRLRSMKRIKNARILPDLFIDRPYVTRIVGDPGAPRSAFLLATRRRKDRNP